MAQKVEVTLVDDIDGGVATETVQFGLDGVAYEIDLNAARASGLRGTLAPFAEHARKVTPRRSTQASRPTTSAGRSASSGDRAEERAWLKDHGHELKDRGRIPGDLHALWVNRDLTTVTTPDLLPRGERLSDAERAELKAHTDALKEDAPPATDASAPAPAATFTPPADAPSENGNAPSESSEAAAKPPRRQGAGKAKTTTAKEPATTTTSDKKPARQRASRAKGSTSTAATAAK